MPVTLNIYPPILGSDGRDQDNPDLFGGYASHCSRLVPQIYAQEAHAGLYPDSLGWKDCTLPGLHCKRRRHEFRWGTRRNTIHLNFHYFSADSLVPFMKNVGRDVIL